MSYNRVSVVYTSRYKVTPGKCEVGKIATLLNEHVAPWNSHDTVDDLHPCPIRLPRTPRVLPWISVLIRRLVNVYPYDYGYDCCLLLSLSFLLSLSRSSSGISYTAIVTYANNNFSGDTLQQEQPLPTGARVHNIWKKKKKNIKELCMHLISQAMILICFTVTVCCAVIT